MKQTCLVFALFALPIAAFANCDLTRYHWGCDMPLNVRHAPQAAASVYCGNTLIYVTRAQYETMVRYQRADVNMILTVNGEYVDSPCIPNRR